MANVPSRSNLFDDFFKEFAPGFFIKPLHGDPLPSAAQIKIDVSEDDKAYTVAAEIPGVKKEDIKVSTEEINQRLGYLAQLYQIPVGKVAKDLQKRDGLIEIYDQIMNQKVIKLLEDNARIEDVQPVTPLPAEAPAAPPG